MPASLPTRRGRRARSRAGFTLIEAALVMVIISFGVLAMLQLLAAGTVSNAEGAQTTTAMNLAKNIREMCVGLPCNDPTTPTHWGAEVGENIATYDDIDDFASRTFAPPIDARRQAIAGLDGWTQTINVVNVDPNRLTIVAPNGSTAAMRVTCIVRQNGQEAYRMSWI